jgi:hypothetical protein
MKVISSFNFNDLYNEQFLDNKNEFIYNRNIQLASSSIELPLEIIKELYSTDTNYDVIVELLTNSIIATIESSFISTFLDEIDTIRISDSIETFTLDGIYKEIKEKMHEDGIFYIISNKKFANFLPENLTNYCKGNSITVIISENIPDNKFLITFMPNQKLTLNIESFLNNITLQIESSEKYYNKGEVLKARIKYSIVRVSKHGSRAIELKMNN